MTWVRRKKHLDDIFFAPARKHHAHKRRRKGGAPLRSVPFVARMLTRNPRLHLQLLVESRTRPRWASSDSSPDPPKPDKKLSDRLSAAIDAVNDRKLPPELRGRSNAVRSETDIMNVVEQRIWHSMEEGQFENLPGKGKPLDLKTNPHADPAEDTLYRILMRNGCAPEWVELNKEIRCKTNEWRLSLKKAWAKRLDGHDAKWVEESEALKAQLRAINDKVLHYNLIVPFGRQMFGLKWEKELSQMEG